MPINNWRIIPKALYIRKSTSLVGAIRAFCIEEK